MTFNITSTEEHILVHEKLFDSNPMMFFLCVASKSTTHIKLGTCPKKSLSHFENNYFLDCSNALSIKTKTKNMHTRQKLPPKYFGKYMTNIRFLPMLSSQNVQKHRQGGILESHHADSQPFYSNSPNSLQTTNVRTNIYLSLGLLLKWNNRHPRCGQKR